MPSLSSINRDGPLHQPDRPSNYSPVRFNHQRSKSRRNAESHRSGGSASEQLLTSGRLKSHQFIPETLDRLHQQYEER